MSCDSPEPSLLRPCNPARTDRAAAGTDRTSDWIGRNSLNGDDMIKGLTQCECGGEASARSLSYLRGRWFWVVCNTCRTRSADRATLDEAVADWNLRAKRQQQTVVRQPRAKVRRPA